MQIATFSIRRAAARVLLALTGCLLLPQLALADLMLYPSRVVFEKNQRAAQVDLINNGSEAATFRISLVNRRMGENGEFSPITTPEPGEKFADDMLRFSPRQITLQPGVSQTVRIALRKPALLEVGEYRSHLFFERLPKSGGANSVEAHTSDDQQIGIVLNTLVGISIPVIVRHETTAAEVRLSQLALQPANGAKPPHLAFQFDRSGNSSVYGDVTVTYVTPGGPEQTLARMGGVAVYTPAQLRRARIALTIPPGVVLAHGQLHLTYRERPELGGKVLAEDVLVLP